MLGFCDLTTALAGSLVLHLRWFPAQRVTDKDECGTPCGGVVQCNGSQELDPFPRTVALATYLAGTVRGIWAAVLPFIQRRRVPTSLEPRRSRTSA